MIDIPKTLLIVPMLSVGLLFSGCASTAYRPIVDEGASAQLDQDIAACQSYADNYQGDDGVVKNSAVGGALTGAVAGGIEDAWDGALVGALLGGLFGTAEGKLEKSNISNFERKNIVRNCVSGRGHRFIG